MLSVCVVPGKTSFTNENDAVQVLKKMNEGHEDKDGGKEDNVNDKVTEATRDKGEETMLDAETKGGGDESDGDGIADASSARHPSHGEGVMEPISDGDGGAGKIDEGESPPKADEEMMCTNEYEGTKEVDEPMEEGEQQGEASPMEDVNNKPATRVTQVWPWPRRGRAMTHPRQTRQSMGVSMQRKRYVARHPRND